MKNTRSIKNALVRPQQQLSFSVMFFTCLTVVFTGFVLITLFSLRSQILIVAEQAHLSSDLFSPIDQSVWSAMVVVAVVGAIMTIGTLVTSVRLSHRIFGPVVPIKRLIASLRDGDYTAQGHLRKPDAFQDVMTDLNDLAKTLNERHGSGGAESASR